MAVETRNVSNRDHIGHKELPVALVTAVSQTDRPFYLFKPGQPFRIIDAQGFCAVEAGAVTANLLVVGDTDVILAGALTVHSTTHQLALAASRYMIDGEVVTKAAAVAIAFTAAHVVTALKWGIILIQIDAAGAVSSKVPLATQLYDTAAAALAAEPAVDAGNVKVATILIEADAGDWTANTDDLVAASDLTAFTITANPGQGAALDAALAFVSAKSIREVAHTDRARHRGSKNDWILAVYTSDGTGALTNGQVTIRYRGMPMVDDGSVKFD